VRHANAKLNKWHRRVQKETHGHRERRARSHSSIAAGASPRPTSASKNTDERGSSASGGLGIRGRSGGDPAHQEGRPRALRPGRPSPESPSALSPTWPTPATPTEVHDRGSNVGRRRALIRNGEDNAGRGEAGEGWPRSPRAGVPRVPMINGQQRDQLLDLGPIPESPIGCANLRLGEEPQVRAGVHQG
jgi:hypothetical protein